MAKKASGDKQGKANASPYKIKKRGDGRYEVRKRCGGNVNGYDKIAILLEAGLIKTKLPTKKEEAPAAEAPVAEAPAAST